MKTKAVIIAFLLLSARMFGQTFNGSGGQIPDNATVIDFTINVSGLSAPLNSTNFGLEQACIYILHSNVQDMDVSLVAPDGNVVLLTSGNGGSGNNYNGTCFRHDVTTSITQGVPPFSGTYHPEGDISFLNNGQNGNGPWKLRILDTQPGSDQGNLLGWSIAFGSNPASSPLNFSCTELPIVVINTNGQIITNEPKITADLGIIYNGNGTPNCKTDPFNAYSGKVGIELRGSASQTYPQKSYLFETRDVLGNDTNISMLGMPPENDWILCGTHMDRSLIRDAITYELVRQMGHWAPRTKFCEVFRDSSAAWHYRGVYMLMEKIKRDKNRIDISKLDLDDNAGDSLTGGYIFAVDQNLLALDSGWYSLHPQDSNLYFTFKEPKGDEITIQQETYIRAFVDSFENSVSSPNFADPLSGYRKFIDPASFIDFFLMQELGKNLDGYKRSSFMYKDKQSKGGKLKAGPIWDFNVSYGGYPSTCQFEVDTGWCYPLAWPCFAPFTPYTFPVPFWWKRFLQDPVFVDDMKCRWTTLRSTVLDTANIFQLIDSLHNYLAPASVRHFTKYSLNSTIGTATDSVKTWFVNRLAWLDANMPGTCLTGVGNDPYGSENSVMIYPNPSRGQFMVQGPKFSGEGAEIRIMDVVGNVIHQTTFSFKLNLDLNLSNGLYLIEVKKGQERVVKKLLINK